MSRLAQCHGCHGMLGGGLHVGSAIGKNVCIFPHSELCCGGIPESDGWRASPQGYLPQAAVLPSHGQVQLDFDAQLNVSNAQEFGTQANFSSQFARGLAEDNGVAMTDDEDLLRFQRQADGEGARWKVIQERRPARVWFGDEVLPACVEDEVAEHRAENQQAAQLANQGGFQHGIDISAIRKMPGMRDAVDFHLAGIKALTPCLASAPSAAAPGLASSTPAASRGQVFFPSNYDQQVDDGIRVTGSMDHIQKGISGLDHSDLVAQQLADARSKYAEMIQNEMKLCSIKEKLKKQRHSF